jgi:ABC-type nitrate/sulfonate/bicarbonate transport system substrate-binding protein
VSRFILCAVFILAALGQSRAAALDKLSVAGGSFATIVAQEKGFYAARHLQVDVRQLGNSDAVRSALSSGAVEIADFGVDNAFAMAEHGDDIVIIMADENSPIQMVGQKGIATVDQLRGKAILVDAPNTQNAVIMKRILAKQGLTAGVDYVMREAGGQPLRLAALRKDPALGGTMVAWPVYFQMKAEGYPSLGSSLDVVGPMLFLGSFVKRDWAKSHRDIAVRYLAADVEAVRWMTDPKHEADVVALFEKSRGLSPAVSQIAYDNYMGPYGWVRDGKVDLATLARVMKLRAEVEGSWGSNPPPPETYVDTRYLRDALKAVGRK